MALLMISFMMFTAGLILDSVARARAEQLRIHYMSLPMMVRSLDRQGTVALAGEVPAPPSLEPTIAA